MCSAAPRRPRLSPELLGAVLNELDARELGGAATRRTFPRARLRCWSVGVFIEHIGGGSTEHVFCSRNISRQGISLLGDVFVHPGCRLRISLPRVDDTAASLSGKVVHCWHVRGRVHELGVRLDDVINPLHFLTERDQIQIVAEFMEKSVDLEGCILHLTRSASSTQIVRHFLRGTRVRVISAADLGAAKDELRRGVIDLAFVDIDVEGVDPLCACREIRELGFARDLVLATADDQLAEAAACESTISRVMRIPTTKGQFQSMLIDAFQQDDDWSGVPAEYLSSMRDDAGMAPIINQFVVEARQAARLLDKAAQAEDLEAARRIAVSLKGTGGSVGFDTLTEAAQTLLAALDATGSTVASSGQIRQLILICDRVRSTAA